MDEICACDLHSPGTVIAVTGDEGQVIVFVRDRTVFEFREVLNSIFLAPRAVAVKAVPSVEDRRPSRSDEIRSKTGIRGQFLWSEPPPNGGCLAGN